MSEPLKRNRTFRITNNFDSLSSVLKEIEDFCTDSKLGETYVFKILISINEVVTNICCYAFIDQSSHTIEIEVRLLDDSFEVEIQDDGKEFDPTNMPEPDLESSVERRRVGGLGIHVVRKFMDHLSYQRSNGKNKLSLVKYFVRQ